MVELTIDAADIAAVLRKNVEGFRPEVDRAQVGRVLEVADGIARVAGLPHAAVNELLEFEGGAQGLALNLEEETIGRGQRELIIGDRKTGKTTVAIDTILNQKGQDVKCIYVAIGQKGSTVAQTVETLRVHGALEYTVVVSAPASDEAVFKYLAPYTGCAMGHHLRAAGQHATVVASDLSNQH